MVRTGEISRVFLTGYMGSGKTFIGKVLSDKLSWQFIDLDQRISDAESQSISTIFETQGERYFRELEYQEVAKICKYNGQNIISLGGGAFVQENINNLIREDEHSIVVYLKFDALILAKRLKNEKHKRPLIAHAKDLEEFIEDHLAERSAFYERADLIIVNEEDAMQTINQISTYLNYRNQKLSTI